MFYMMSKNENGVWEEAIYHGQSSQFKDEIATMEVGSVIDFKIPGKTYYDKQNNLRDLAIEFQNTWGNVCDRDGLDGIVSMIGLSYSEVQEVYDFFEKNGRRYGLYKEFKENCVC